MSNTPLGDQTRLADALRLLAETIDARANDGDGERSWTAKLLQGGTGACADKIREEGGELADAITEESESRVASEAADLLYHMLVGLRARGVSLDEVAKTLEARRGTSGIEEKASREQ